MNNYIAIIIGSKMESLCVAFVSLGRFVCCFISHYSPYIHFDFFLLPCAIVVLLGAVFFPRKLEQCT